MYIYIYIYIYNIYIFYYYYILINIGNTKSRHKLPFTTFDTYRHSHIHHSRFLLTLTFNTLTLDGHLTMFVSIYHVKPAFKLLCTNDAMTTRSIVVTPHSLLPLHTNTINFLLIGTFLRDLHSHLPFLLY